MDVKSCRTCGRLFNYLSGQPICPACKKKLENKFIEVRDYIRLIEHRTGKAISTQQQAVPWLQRENDSATMQQIADDNEVSVKQLKQWVREERLTFTEKSPVGIECESCGAMIRTGRFCEKCKNNMATNLKEMYAMPVVEHDTSSKKRDKDRMRFLDKA